MKHMNKSINLLPKSVVDWTCSEQTTRHELRFVRSRATKKLLTTRYKMAQDIIHQVMLRGGNGVHDKYTVYSTYIYQ